MKKELLKKVLEEYEREGGLKNDLFETLFEIRVSKVKEILKELENIPNLYYKITVKEKYNLYIKCELVFAEFESYEYYFEIFNLNQINDCFKMEEYMIDFIDWFDNAESAAKFIINKIKNDYQEGYKE